MTLAELGALLREERVGQGLMVEDVAARLKIPTRILRAIEEGEVSELPHTVYTCGFIKGYGLILGYSNERIAELLDGLEDFDDGFSPYKIQQMRPVVETETSGGRRVLGLVLKLLIIGLLAGGGYAYYTYTFRAGDEVPVSTGESPAQKTAGQSTESATASMASTVSGASATSELSPSGAAPSAGFLADRPSSAPQAESTTNAEADTSPEPLSAAPSPAAAETAPGVTQAAASGSDAAATAGGDAVPTARPASEDAPVSTRGFTLDTPEPPAEGGVTDGATGLSVVSEAALPPGMHQIVLTAEASCWVHANADKTDTREFILQEGETFAMPFRDSLTLRLGNAGGVKIKYDGRDMPSPGKPGQVKNITFPPAE